MARWEPNARGRLGEAAMTLYSERGYDQTTVADIAEAAGLTSRTFFRYYADKREVLFAGSEALVETMLDAVPEDGPPLEAVAAALDAAARLIGGNRAYSRERQRIIDSSPELRERELIKLSSMAGTLADALRARGVADPHAQLAAEAGLAVFRVAFATWLAADDERSLADVMRESFEGLTALASVPARGR
jgi:AcrR family transcriptional regulator